MSGAIDLMPQKYLDGAISESQEKILRSRGYFMQESEMKDMSKRLLEIGQRHAQNVPYWFYILTTLNCNFQCPICYEKKVKTNADIASSVLNNIFSFISEFQSAYQLSSEKIFLVVFGGDPLCVKNPEIIKSILIESARRGWKVIVVTNGSQIKKFMRLFESYSSSVSHFRITLDGPEKIHNMRRPYLGGRGSFEDVIGAIDLLLQKGFLVKMQTILGAGTYDHLDEIFDILKKNGWLKASNFEWRIEGSHDYANLDSEKDEITEGVMVKKIIDLVEAHPELQKKMRFESFKYLAHIVSSFGWLGRYKTYWGPKIGFCEPQKGFHYVFSTDGNIYHCPRTINLSAFNLGTAAGGLTAEEKEIKHQAVFERENCFSCPLNTLCGGGCIVQKNYYP
ncbi:MAG: radical SAM protein, partial [Patescibacteria group bacterium]